MGDRRRDNRGRPPPFEARPPRHPPSDMPPFSKPSMNSRPLPEPTPHLSRGPLERQRRREPGDEGPRDPRRRPPDYDDRYPCSASVPPIHFDGPMRDDIRDGRGQRGRRLAEEHDELSLESYDYRASGGGDPRGPPGSSERQRRPQSAPRYGGDRDRFFENPDRARHSFGYPERHGDEREHFDGFRGHEGRDPEFYRGHGDPQRFGDDMDHEHRSGRMQHWPDDNHEWPPPPGPRYGDERGRNGHMDQRPFVPEYCGGFGEEPPSAMCHESRRSSSVPARRLDWGPEEFYGGPCERGPPDWQDEFGNLSYRPGPPGPPIFGGPERGPFSSRDYHGGNMCDPDGGRYDEIPPRSSNRDRGYHCPREFEEHNREMSGISPYEEHLANSTGPGQRPFREGYSEGQGRERFSSRQEPMPGPMVPKGRCPPQGVPPRDVGLRHDGPTFEKPPVMPDRNEGRPFAPNHPKSMEMEQGPKSHCKDIYASPSNPWPDYTTCGFRDQRAAPGYDGPPLRKEGLLGDRGKPMGGIPDRSAASVPPLQRPCPAIPARPTSTMDVSQRRHRAPQPASQCQGPPGIRGPPEQRSLREGNCKIQCAPTVSGTTEEQRQRPSVAPPGSSVSQKPQEHFQPATPDKCREQPPIAPCRTSLPQPPQAANIPSVTAQQQRQQQTHVPRPTTTSQAPQTGNNLPVIATQQPQPKSFAPCGTAQSTNVPTVKNDQQQQRPPAAPSASSISQVLQSEKLPTAPAEQQRQRSAVPASVSDGQQASQSTTCTLVKADEVREKPVVAASTTTVQQIAPKPATQKSPSALQSKADLPPASDESCSLLEERPSAIEDRKLQRPISFPLPKGKLEQLANQVFRPNLPEKGQRAPTVGTPQSQVNAQSGNDKQLSGSSDKQQRPSVSQGASGSAQNKGPCTSLASQQPTTGSALPPASPQKALPAPPQPPSQLTSQAFFTAGQPASASTGTPTPCNLSASCTTDVRPPVTAAYPQQFFPMTYRPAPFAQERYMMPAQQAGPCTLNTGFYEYQQTPSPFVSTGGGQFSVSGALPRTSVPTPSYFTKPQGPAVTNAQQLEAGPPPTCGQAPSSSATQEQPRPPTLTELKVGDKNAPSKLHAQADDKSGQTQVPDQRENRPEGGDHDIKKPACESVLELSVEDDELRCSDIEIIDSDGDNNETSVKKTAKVAVGGTAQTTKAVGANECATKSDRNSEAPPSVRTIQSKNQIAVTEKRRPEPLSKESTSTADETRVLEDEAYPKNQVCFFKREEPRTNSQALVTKKPDTEMKDAEKSLNQEPLAKDQNAKVLKDEGALKADKDVLYGPRPPSAEDIERRSQNTSVPDKTGKRSDIESTSGNKPNTLNDHEVSSSTQESAVAGSSGLGKQREAANAGLPSTSAEKKAEDEVARRDEPKFDDKIEKATSRKRDDSSDERSGHSSERSSRRNDDSYRSRSSKRRRTYSSSDDRYDEDDSDVENTNDGVCLSGRGNEGQVFGIPVVFKAISTTRTFWNIRGGQVARELEEVVGDNVVNQKINRAGFLCVNVATAADAVKLLNLTSLGGAQVESVIPSMYLRHEAKIRGVPYHYTNEKLAELFAGVGVVSARRQLTVKRLHDGTYEEFPRSSVVLTFKPDATLPKTLELDNEKFIVEEYIEAPLQCFKCLRFGHTSRACVSVSRCKNCGARYCEEECERRTPMCANCFGPHQATYVGCPRRREVAFASLWKRTFDLNAL